MGETAITMTITPDGPDADLKHIEAELKKNFPIKDLKEEPVGFGVTLVKIMFVVDDKKEGLDTDKIESRIRAIKGVGDVRTDDVTLL